RCVGGRVGPPDVEVPELVGRAAPGCDEPRVPVRGVVHDEVDDHPDTSVVGGADQLDEVTVGAQPRIDPVVVGDVVPVVAVRGRVERHQPQTGDADVGEVVDPLGQPGEVT